MALKNFKKSPLLSIEGGVGEKTVRKVLEVFPDIYTREDVDSVTLSKMCKMPLKTASLIVDYVNSLR